MSGNKKKSKCMYCDSTNYGLGCPYSPAKIHIHADVENCIYCGSSNSGLGCPYNPMKRKIHVHGLEFNSMLTDNIEKSTITGYLIHKLTEDIKDTKAFKLGLIDENGHRVKNPETLEEKSSLTHLDSYILKLRRILGPRVDLLNSSMYAEAINESNSSQESLELYEQEIIFKNKVENVVSLLYNIIEEGKQNGLTSATFENIILNVFLDRLE